jgi:hypothetical protein
VEKVFFADAGVGFHTVFGATSMRAISASSSSRSETSSRARSYRHATFSGLESSIAKLHEPTVVCRRQ